jgi:hypothetical protein
MPGHKGEAAMADTTEATPDPENEPETETKSDSDLGDAGKAALEAERRARRAADRELKAAKVDLDALKASLMSEAEKAVAEAKAAGLAEGLRTGSAKIVQAEIRAAAAGRSVDVDALLENVDTSRFIDDGGEVDRAAIAAWIERIAPTPAEPEIPAFADLGQGTRGQPISPGDDDALKSLILKAVGGPRK